MLRALQVLVHGFYCLCQRAHRVAQLPEDSSLLIRCSLVVTTYHTLWVLRGCHQLWPLRMLVATRHALLRGCRQ